MKQDGADLVVVGAGSAGAVVASRVSERSDREVLLVEAGPDYPDLARLPRDLVDGTRNSWREHDWGYDFKPTVEQRVRFAFPRGKVVGGSSAVNTCIALRGHAYDFDEWAARGLPEWTFEECLRAFVRLEDDRDFGDAPYHGKGGPIPVRRHPPRELCAWQSAFVEACRELGHPACADTNDPDTKGGVGPQAMNKIDGVRMSAARGYLTSAVRARPNLRIRANTLAHRVVFEGGRVAGLEVSTAGEVEVLRARRVVLSAGAIATPGVLLRSGVGPRRELERLGVDLVSDVPAVGARLLDHPGTAIILAPRGVAVSTKDALIQTMLRYTSGDQLASPRAEHPLDMQIQAGSFLPLHPLLTLPAITLMCCVGKPRGAGTIRFPSADPRAAPLIEGRMLEEPQDHARAVEAVTTMYAILRTRAMKGLFHFFWPSRAVISDKEALGHWIGKSTGSGYHPCGTAPMGAEGDVEAATDGRGQVRGAPGLIVADASLMPTVPSANTNLPSLMIGERFGAWLRDELDAFA
ncbi:MAG TPA: GMC family oxidoreductase N-terminal domain-containing protein [Byssovorax sp.]|jgi:choline dehydrogenase